MLRSVRQLQTVAQQLHDCPAADVRLPFPVKGILYIEDITQVVISYEIYQTSLRLYEMTTSDSVIFCLSYGMTFQNGFLSPLKWTFFQREMYCCHERRHDVTCSRRKC